jgi:hypothetical protein
MQQAIIRVFDEFDHAEHARDALVESGFARDAVEVSVREDEAGPVEGNFTVGNVPVESQQSTYGNSYRNPRMRGHCMVMVHAADSDVAAHAVAILERCGGRDPDPAARYLR